MLTRDCVVKFFLRLYRLLLVAYPVGFRHRFGPEMVQVLRDRYHESARSNATPVLSLVGHTLLDLLTTALRERYRDLEEKVQHRFHSSAEFFMMFFLTASFTVGLHWILWGSITSIMARHPVAAVIPSHDVPDQSFWELALVAIGLIAVVIIFACVNFRMLCSRRQRSYLSG
jgi:hypothetical protein